MHRVINVRKHSIPAEVDFLLSPHDWEVSHQLQIVHDTLDVIVQMYQWEVHTLHTCVIYRSFFIQHTVMKIDSPSYTIQHHAWTSGDSAAIEPICEI
jgi:hypothetical protein